MNINFFHKNDNFFGNKSIIFRCHSYNKFFGGHFMVRLMSIILNKNKMKTMAKTNFSTQFWLNNLGWEKAVKLMYPRVASFVPPWLIRASVPVLWSITLGVSSVSSFTVTVIRSDWISGLLCVCGFQLHVKWYYSDMSINIYSAICTAKSLQYNSNINIIAGQFGWIKWFF